MNENQKADEVSETERCLRFEVRGTVMRIYNGRERLLAVLHVPSIEKIEVHMRLNGRAVEVACNGSLLSDVIFLQPDFDEFLYLYEHMRNAG